ncbi:MAG: hypothetical protein M1826_000413 [Phylliscum demangeonii]|nr:MAG: hypothetical protein M1826_004139 [Phylliscum demangeonii]KAI9822709.1 MAG: hypothetical protein M1826_000413 [Phylliscum demangeonii]
MLPRLIYAWQLTREEEVASGAEETEVRREDQDKINKFSRLHRRESLLVQEVATKHKDKEDLDEVSTELELADEDHLIPYQMGDAFVMLPLPEVQQLLAEANRNLDEEVLVLDEQLGNIRNEMQELKVALYARFGQSINLD